MFQLNGREDLKDHTYQKYGAELLHAIMFAEIIFKSKARSVILIIMLLGTVQKASFVLTAVHSIVLLLY